MGFAVIEPVSFPGRGPPLIVLIRSPPFFGGVSYYSFPLNTFLLTFYHNFGTPCGNYPSPDSAYAFPKLTPVIVPLVLLLCGTLDSLWSLHWPTVRTTHEFLEQPLLDFLCARLTP